MKGCLCRTDKCIIHTKWAANTWKDSESIIVFVSFYFPTCSLFCIFLTFVTKLREGSLPKFITVVAPRTRRTLCDIGKTRNVTECTQWAGKFKSMSGAIWTIIAWRTGAVLVENNRSIAIVTIKFRWTHLQNQMQKNYATNTKTSFNFHSQYNKQ